ncbi:MULTISPECIES: hypothetical protein [Methyloversatilis]|jgi:hypothetical protein|uniref:hypothetical protein n=1 Tax=Methyloversatilis TaxID=378210 RepID=UPI00311459AF
MTRRDRVRAIVLALCLGVILCPAARAAERIRFADFFIGETWQAGVGMSPKLRLSSKMTSLHGRQVELLGFMDGMLPRDGMYFMIIREPVLGCPFHSVEFDWSGFAAVFVRKGTDYIDGPIRVTGRLDVGRRLDETGFESYVRIYEAEIVRVR